MFMYPLKFTANHQMGTPHNERISDWETLNYESKPQLPQTPFLPNPTVYSVPIQATGTIINFLCTYQ